MNHIKNWKDVVDIFEAKLYPWKANSLSFRGHITLLKFVLSSLSIYYYSIFKAPLHVINSIERIRDYSIWVGMNSNARIH